MKMVPLVPPPGADPWFWGLRFVDGAAEADGAAEKPRTPKPGIRATQLVGFQAAVERNDGFTRNTKIAETNYLKLCRINKSVKETNSKRTTNGANKGPSGDEIGQATPDNAFPSRT